MFHQRAYVGVTPSETCADCGIVLPPNYECTDCRWENFLSLRDKSVVEICTQLCRDHVLDYPEPVRIRN